MDDVRCDRNQNQYRHSTDELHEKRHSRCLSIFQAWLLAPDSRFSGAGKNYEVVLNSLISVLSLLRQGYDQDPR